jgi:hypothetical protein
MGTKEIFIGPNRPHDAFDVPATIIDLGPNGKHQKRLWTFDFDGDDKLWGGIQLRQFAKLVFTSGDDGDSLVVVLTVPEKLISKSFRLAAFLDHRNVGREAIQERGFLTKGTTTTVPCDETHLAILARRIGYPKRRTAGEVGGDSSEVDQSAVGFQRDLEYKFGHHSSRMSFSNKARNEQ